MIYELRLYTVAPGRLPDVHSRFADHLPPLFERHGVECVGRWSALAGPDAPRFVYLLAYRDYAHREAVWGGFYVDEDWWRVRAETNAGSEMVLRHDLYFLKPSPVWTQSAAGGEAAVGGLHELVLQEFAAGQGAGANKFLQDNWLPAMRNAGAKVLGVFDMAAGAGMQKAVIVLAWPDAATWHAGRKAIENSTELGNELARQRQDTGTTAIGRAEVNLLDPAPGAVRADLGRVG